MRTKFFAYFVLLFTSIFMRGQTQTPFVLNLSSDHQDAIHEEDVGIDVFNTANVKVSGYFDSKESVLVRPDPDVSITIVPASSVFRAPMGGGNGTTIKSGGGSGGYTPPPGGRMSSGQSDTKGIAIYPNPVQSNLSFQLENEEVILYEIYDLNNILMLTESIEPTSISTIDVARLNSGSYILKLKTQKNQYLTVQFLKK